MPQTLGEIRLTLGETRRIRFRLRKVSTGAFLNVNMATSIALEANLKNEVPVTPLIADRDSGDDDWVAGLVTFLPEPSGVTARVGTYDYRVIVYGYEDDENPVFDGGIIEVEHRTSVLAFSGPYGAWYTDHIEDDPAYTNIAAGMPVRLVDGVLRPADTVVDGVALVDASGSYIGLWGTRGWVERASWLALAGTDYLVPDTDYYLAPGGTLALSGDVKVGRADSPTRLAFGR